MINYLQGQKMKIQSKKLGEEINELTQSNSPFNTFTKCMKIGKDEGVGNEITKNYHKLMDLSRVKFGYINSYIYLENEGKYVQNQNY